MTDLISLAAAFAPHEALAERLLPHAVSGNDGSHDTAHLIRVWKNALLRAVLGMIIEEIQ